MDCSGSLPHQCLADLFLTEVNCCVSWFNTLLKYSSISETALHEQAGLDLLKIDILKFATFNVFFLYCTIKITIHRLRVMVSYLFPT